MLYFVITILIFVNSEERRNLGDCSNNVSEETCRDHDEAWNMCDSGEYWWVIYACKGFCNCVPTKSPVRFVSTSPTTSQPTSAPNTSSPTTSQPTSAPNKSPTTSQPTSAPNTREPTTSQPTSAPNTREPTRSPVCYGHYEQWHSSGLNCNDFFHYGRCDEAPNCCACQESSAELSKGVLAISKTSGKCEVSLTESECAELAGIHRISFQVSPTSDLPYPYGCYQITNGRLWLWNPIGIADCSLVRTCWCRKEDVCEDVAHISEDVVQHVYDEFGSKCSAEGCYKEDGSLCIEGSACMYALLDHSLSDKDTTIVCDSESQDENRGMLQRKYTECMDNGNGNGAGSGDMSGNMGGSDKSSGDSIGSGSGRGSGSGTSGCYGALEFGYLTGLNCYQFHHYGRCNEAPDCCLCQQAMSYSPTISPTLPPSTSPITSVPTNNPVTSMPSKTPTTTNPSVSPSTSEPTTNQPSLSPTTSIPSWSPTFFASEAPSTSLPSQQPISSSPSQNPTTSNPSQSPTTPNPTKTPTTSYPTQKPFTSNPTKTPSQNPVTSFHNIDSNTKSSYK